jgi:hypothetical protein
MPIGHGGGESVERAQQNSGGEAEITQERAQAAAIAPTDAPLLQAAAAVLRTSQRYFGI